MMDYEKLHELVKGISTANDLENAIRQDGFEDTEVILYDGIRIGNDFFWADHDDADLYYKGSWEGYQSGNCPEVTEDNTFTFEQLKNFYTRYCLV